jgi:hypothetical protein
MTDKNSLNELKTYIITKTDQNKYTTADIIDIISKLLEIIRTKEHPTTDPTVSNVPIVNKEAAAAAAEAEAAAEVTETEIVVGGKRKPSKYNIFMKKELERLKKKDPSSDHKQRFKDAVKNWNNKK